MRTKALMAALLLSMGGLIPGHLQAQSNGEGDQALVQAISRAIRMAKALETEEQAFIARHGYAIPVSIENLAMMMQRVRADLHEAKPILDFMIKKAQQHPDPAVAQWQWLQMMALLQSQQWGGFDSQMRLQQIQQERKSFDRERWKTWAESFGNPYQ